MLDSWSNSSSTRLTSRVSKVGKDKEGIDIVSNRPMGDTTREERRRPETSMKLPPAQPTYVLRGHTAAIHSLDFISANTRLLSGDGDGWVVVWDVVTKRPVAVWKAHENAILGMAAWGSDKIITCVHQPFDILPSLRS